MRLLTFEAGWLIWAVLALAALAFWIFALVDILKSNFRRDYEKVIWVIVIIFMPFLGSILYFLIGRNNRVQ